MSPALVSLLVAFVTFFLSFSISYFILNKIDEMKEQKIAYRCEQSNDKKVIPHYFSYAFCWEEDTREYKDTDAKQTMVMVEEITEDKLNKLFDEFRYAVKQIYCDMLEIEHFDKIEVKKRALAEIGVI